MEASAYLIIELRGSSRSWCLGCHKFRWCVDLVILAFGYAKRESWFCLLLVFSWGSYEEKVVFIQFAKHLYAILWCFVLFEQGNELVGVFQQAVRESSFRFKCGASRWVFYAKKSVTYGFEIRIYKERGVHTLSSHEMLTLKLWEDSSFVERRCISNYWNDMAHLEGEVWVGFYFI